MDVAKILTYKYGPSGWAVTDFGNGFGPIITYWDTDLLGVKPSTFEIQAWFDEVAFATTLASKQEAVKNLRAAKGALGTAFPFSDGPGTVQTRSEDDYINVTGFVNMAMLLNTQGVEAAVMIFRDEENITHTITPQEAIQMGMATAMRKQELASTSWVHHDALEHFTTLAEVMAYDITTGWPV